MRWDLFCRVIDNLGDIGVCWRLAADLAARGESVRLIVDDARALAWMAPQGAAGVEVHAWEEPWSPMDPGDVVIEAFGCEVPAPFVERMRRPRPPVWINLEYLSAQSYVERSHGLPSPRDGLMKWFFYPGFTAATGGLIREPWALAPGAAPWADWGVAPRAGERIVTLFAYPDAPFDQLFGSLDTEPTLLLLAAGASQAPAQAAVEARPRQHLRAHALPWLTQRDFDRLLHAADLNFARGEDSIVRAFWAGAPCVWQIYRQDDGVHAHKLEALLQRMGAGEPVAALWRAWNRLGSWPAALPARADWERAARAWRDQLLAQTELTSQLRAFAASKR